MALDATRLGTAIKAVFTANGAADNAATTALCNGLATAIISEFTSNAVVSPAGTPTPLTAPVGGGPVTGTGKVT